MDYSKVPIDLSRVKPEDVDKEMLRASIWVELDTVNLYEQFLAVTKDEELKKVISDINDEEKKHAAEFMELLLHLDPGQVTQFKLARDEVRKFTGWEIPEV